MATAKSAFLQCLSHHLPALFNHTCSLFPSQRECHYCLKTEESIRRYRSRAVMETPSTSCHQMKKTLWIRNSSRSIWMLTYQSCGRTSQSSSLHNRSSARYHVWDVEACRFRSRSQWSCKKRFSKEWMLSVQLCKSMSHKIGGRRAPSSRRIRPPWPHLSRLRLQHKHLANSHSRFTPGIYEQSNRHHTS
jgi:hypothetical protein